MFAYRASLDRAEVAFTDRHGGTSAPPFDTLNLGQASGAEAEAVERNHELVAVALGVDRRRLVRMRQVHGADVAVVRSAPAEHERPQADGFVTDEPGLVLTVRVADCVPVLLADPEAEVVGCTHAGRAGVAGRVVPRTVDRMRDLGARRITAWVGPHVCGACYEVPAAMQVEVAAAVPATRSTTSWGTPALDLGAGVVAQLRESGCDVVTVDGCTRESPDLFSHRRDGERSGRFGGFVWLRPTAGDGS